MKSGNNEPSKSTSWKVLETVLSNLKIANHVEDQFREISSFVESPTMICVKDRKSTFSALSCNIPCNVE